MTVLEGIVKGCVYRGEVKPYVNYAGLWRSKLRGITILVSLAQYFWLVLCNSPLEECNCSKISNFYLERLLNLIIPAVKFFWSLAF